MSMHGKFKVLALAAGLCMSVAASAASTAVVWADSTQNLLIEFTLDPGFSGSLSPATPLVNWGVSLTFNQAANTALVQSNHIIAPHGEPAHSAPEFVYSGIIAPPVGPEFFSNSFNHSGHEDLFTYLGTSPTHGYLMAAHVPEPESYALALAGLGVAGLMTRRRLAA